MKHEVLNDGTAPVIGGLDPESHPLRWVIAGRVLADTAAVRLWDKLTFDCDGIGGFAAQLYAHNVRLALELVLKGLIAARVSGLAPAPKLQRLLASTDLVELFGEVPRLRKLTDDESDLICRVRQVLSSEVGGRPRRAAALSIPAAFMNEDNETFVQLWNYLERELRRSRGDYESHAA